MKTRALFIGLFLCFMAVPCFGQTTVEQRTQRLVEVAGNEYERSFFTVTAQLASKNNVPYALQMLDSLTADESIGGMFYSYALIGCYLHTQQMLPDSLHKKVRKAFRERTMYRGDTENHWVMYYTGVYLAAQTWPNLGRSEWYNGRSSQENFSEAKEWLELWMNTAATIGQGEFDSPTYITTYLTPMVLLYDFAADPVMKRRTQMMIDLLLADFAAEHLQGNYGGGHSRDYPEDIINPLGAPATMWAWLYFGEPKFEQWEETRYRPRHRGGWETVFGALSSYRIPDVIYRMATDRSKAYVHRETKRVRNVIRFGREKNPPVYKYTYVTKNYVLGSLHGGILQPIQQHTWDVTYVSDKPNNTLFTLHPYYEGKELAMFFPEEQKFLADEVDRYHKVYTNPNKWNSSSPYEQTFQHRNTLIVLYHIAPGAKHSHIDGFFSKNLDERIIDPSGWIFSRAGTTYIALYPLKPFEWIEEPVNWRWRSLVLKNGIIVEVGSEEEDGSFQEFQKKVGDRKPATDQFDKLLRVGYTTRHGDAMRFTFNGQRVLNGKPVPLSTGQLFQGPFISSKLRSGVIRMNHGKAVRELDFNTVSIREYQTK